VAFAAAMRWGELRARLPAVLVTCWAAGGQRLVAPWASLQLLVLAPGWLYSRLLLERGHGALRRLSGEPSSSNSKRSSKEPSRAEQVGGSVACTHASPRRSTPLCCGS
jgi:hypothetical protein